MKFKDRLKELRQERGISQERLANEIFVSRSAVAKWENGLGIPGKDSYDALLRYFGVSEEELALNEESDGCVAEKTRTIHTLITIIIAMSLVLSILFVFLLMSAFSSGFGFTPEAAVGEYWADNERIETEKYTFFYSTTTGLVVIDRVRIVEKGLIGYTEIDTGEHKRAIYDENGKHFGNLISIFDGREYHNFFGSVYYSEGGHLNVHVLDEITIKEERFELFLHSYFKTEYEIHEFSSNGAKYTVK